jgi:hypothetical protein
MTEQTYARIRRSPIAGQWYPGKAETLAQEIDRLFQAVQDEELPGELVGLIAPHAGYPYSGSTAAHAYRLLFTRPFERVIILGPSHYAYVGDYAVPSEEAFETPLGLVPLDEAFVAGLAERVTLQRTHDDREHSLEIQLPFLQRALDHFRLVPIMMSADDLPPCQRLADALADLIGDDRSTLLVASSDQHHLHDYQQVERRDAVVRQALLTFDIPYIAEVLMQPGTTVCGRMPILALLMAAKKLGANGVKVLAHTHSSQVTGQLVPGTYTVGYLAAAVYR